MAEPTPQQVQDFIAAGLACEHLSVEGDGRHFFATIVSAEFEGLDGRVWTFGLIADGSGGLLGR